MRSKVFFLFFPFLFPPRSLVLTLDVKRTPKNPSLQKNRPRYIESLLEKAEKRKKEEEIAKERR